MPEKGLKQVVVANAMHLYNPTSLWCVTQQWSESSYNKSNPKKHLESRTTFNTYCHAVADFVSTG